MSLKGWKELEKGAIIPKPATSLQNKTGSWRNMKPVFKAENCINCLNCWWVCPDNAILVENEKMVGINYDYCKGCGICVNECPQNKRGKIALDFVEEEK